MLHGVPDHVTVKVSRPVRISSGGMPSAHAAPAAYLTLDHSSNSMVEPKAVAELWKSSLPAKLTKLYPVSKWGFSTQVEGGFDDAGLVGDAAGHIGLLQCLVLCRCVMHLYRCIIDDHNTHVKRQYAP